MKKVLSLVLCFVLVAVMALPAFAASYTVGDNGNAVYDNAHGYVFGIDSINGTVNETVVIFDSQESYDACASVWSIYIHLNKVADNVYVAAQNAVAGDGSKPAYVVAESDIVLVAHSSSSDPTQADSYPNWQDKVAAVAVKAGDYFTFSGVDLEAGTVAAGATATCTAENPAKPADKVINLLAGTTANSGDETQISVTLENGVLTAESLTEYWPSTTLTFPEAVTVPVEGTYVEFEAVIVDAHSLWQPTGSIRLNADGGSIWLHQFGENPSLVNSGDSNPATISYKLALSDLGYINDDLLTSSDITAEEVTFNTLSVFAVNGAKVTITKLNLIVPGEGGEGGEEVVIVKGNNIAKNYVTSDLFRMSNVTWGWDESFPVTYPDEGSASLTDGVKDPGNNDYQNVVWAGFSQDPTYQEIGYHTITVDLGETKDIYEATVYLATTALGNGIGATNATVQFFVSDDNENWTPMSDELVPADSADVNYVAVSAQALTSGRYVQARLARGGWLFVSEIEVYEAVKSTSGGNKPEVIVETITVDGDLTDTGWLEDGWTIVNKDNGTFQGGIESMKNAASKAFSYKFQMRTDDTKLYVAAIFDDKLEEIDDKSYGTKFRLWINTNEEATVYTHFYDIYTKGGVIVAEGKYNTSTTENKGAMIGATEGNSAYSGTFVGTMKEVNGKTYFEMSVDLAEFGGEEGFNYFFNAGHKTVDGESTDNIQMLYPAVVVPTEEGADKLANFPYRVWAAANDATADVEALKLGERVVDPEEPEEQPDTSMMGTAPTDSKFTATVSGPEAWKAGDKFTVDVTIEVTADELELSQIMFNLFYDAADVELTLPEELGAVNITTGADSWKGEDSMMTVSEVDGYGKIEVSLATVEEADVLKKGDKIVVSFEFTVKEGAEGLINFQLSNEELNGYTYDDPATALAGTGSSLAIAPAGDNLGDAGIYAIAALAIVALIGTAVVIKKRA